MRLHGHVAAFTELMMPDRPSAFLATQMPSGYSRLGGTLRDRISCQTNWGLECINHMSLDGRIS